jgi:hypothetical protein
MFSQGIPRNISKTLLQGTRRLSSVSIQRCKIRGGRRLIGGRPASSIRHGRKWGNTQNAPWPATTRQLLNCDILLITCLSGWNCCSVGWRCLVRARQSGCLCLWLCLCLCLRLARRADTLQATCKVRAVRWSKSELGSTNEFSNCDTSYWIVASSLDPKWLQSSRKFSQKEIALVLQRGSLRLSRGRYPDTFLSVYYLFSDFLTRDSRPFPVRYLKHARPA